MKRFSYRSRDCHAPDTHAADAGYSTTERWLHDTNLVEIY